MDQKWFLNNTHVSLLHLLSHVPIHLGVHQLLEVLISNGVPFDFVDGLVQELASSLLQTVVIVDRDDGLLALGHDDLNTEELFVEELIADTYCT